MLHDVREAVEDWPKMHEKAVSIADGLNAADLPVGENEVEEARELLEWLADEHFTFLGYREYDFTMEGEQGILRGRPGTGLGILRPDPKPGSGKLPPEVSAKAQERKLLILTKANSRSTVHRSTYLDYVGIKQFDENGEPVRECRFIGLLSSTAYTESVMQVPVLRRKALELFRLTGFDPNSHSGKGLLDVLETYPRDELLQAPVEDLLPIVQSVLHLQERRAVKLFVRRDVYNRYLSCLVYLPRDRYTTAVRLKMQQILKDAIGAETVTYAAYVTESVLARVHFVVRMKQGETVGEYDAELLEQQVIEATRAWADDFTAALHAQGGDGAVTQLARRYANAFPEAYKEDFDARVAVNDVNVLESLPAENGLAMSLYSPIDEEWEGERRFKVFRTGTALSLSQVLPHLTHMGVEVIDERPYEIRCDDGTTAYIYDFGLKAPEDTEEREELRKLFSDTFQAVWEGRAESDELNALVLRGSLSWRQVSILRAYQRYIRQGGTPFSQDYIENTFLNHVDVAGLLVQLFETSFDPARGAADDPDRTSAGGPAGEGDPGRAGHGAEPGRGPDPAVLPDRDEGDAADELLPARSGRPAAVVHLAEAGAEGDPGPAAAAAGVRDLRVLAAGRRCAPALRRGRARRSALVGPARGLPDRGARPGEGADGEELGDRAGRREGRVLRQAAARPVRRPGRLAGRGHRVVQDVHLRAARHHRQHRCRGHRSAARRGPVRR